MGNAFDYIFRGGVDARICYSNNSVLRHFVRLYTTPSYKILCMFRIGHGLRGILRKIYAPIYQHKSRKCLIELGLEAEIGEGLMFAHGGPIVINANARIGKRCIIHPCVLIGGDRKTGAPIIGDNVFIGHGTKIIGKIHIGDNTFISPAAVITKDIPSDSVVGAGFNNIIKTEGGLQAVKRYNATII